MDPRPKAEDDIDWGGLAHETLENSRKKHDNIPLGWRRVLKKSASDPKTDLLTLGVDGFSFFRRKRTPPRRA